VRNGVASRVALKDTKTFTCHVPSDERTSELDICQLSSSNTISLAITSGGSLHWLDPADAAAAAICFSTNAYIYIYTHDTRKGLSCHSEGVERSRCSISAALQRKYEWIG
jgi:hypothetical protein